jgi:lipopolysaccharide transport system permease protein
LTTAVLALPVVVAVQFVLTLGLAYGVALLHVPFRDTQYLLGIALQLLFFLTPIFYDVAAVPELYRGLLQLNPMVHLLAAYRAILMEGRLPDFHVLSGLALLAVMALAFGYILFKRARFRFADEL